MQMAGSLLVICCGVLFTLSFFVMADIDDYATDFKCHEVMESIDR